MNLHQRKKFNAILAYVTTPHPKPYKADFAAMQAAAVALVDLIETLDAGLKKSIVAATNAGYGRGYRSGKAYAKQEECKQEPQIELFRSKDYLKPAKALI